ncbi:hypothetical protein [Mucilaginibacter aquariorum]|uniref:DUF4369 domain-containing protein n=1 Tax=Mucilaginibacter aquariorum TaxID=2967225 RepID=A0ABT1T471_9SPHI|nr:hypothetical protein [Mucilaginibacter aquariorum]MCQ6959417.1 hypothetical protein [Mucilaginibacter aquariorum]
MRKISLLLCILSITIGAKAQFFGGHWDQGYYYDLNGKKHKGLILWEVGDKINFKLNKDADKIKVSSKMLKSFVVKTDSFVVSKSDLLIDDPFLKVVVNNEMKLFEARNTHMYASGGNFIQTKNYYGTNANDVCKLEKKIFVQIMSIIMADKQDVVAKIKDKTLRLNELERTIEFYKTGTLPPPPPKPDPNSFLN